MKITSLQNEKVKKWVKLKEKKYRDLANCFLIEGDHLVTEALKNNLVKEIISIEEQNYENIPCYQVTLEIIKKISDQVSPSSIVAVCQKKDEKELIGSILLLDNIQDPGNLGTIIRSAVAFNIQNIVLSTESVDLYNAKVLRSTEGMIFNINVVRTKLDEILPVIKEKYIIIGTDVTNGSQIEEIKIQKDFCLIIGNEGQGMSKLCRNYCDKFVYIPMNHACESLNASVSASILMYELGKKVAHE